MDQNIVNANEYFRLAENGDHWGAKMKSYNYYVRWKGLPGNLVSSAEVIEAAAESGDKIAKRLIS